MTPPAEGDGSAPAVGGPEDTIALVRWDVFAALPNGSQISSDANSNHPGVVPVVAMLTNALSPGTHPVLIHDTSVMTNESPRETDRKDW